MHHKELYDHNISKNLYNFEFQLGWLKYVI